MSWVNSECLHCAPPGPAPIKKIHRFGSDTYVVHLTVSQHVSPYSHYLFCPFHPLLERACYCKIFIPLAFDSNNYETNAKICSHLFTVRMISPEFHLKVRFHDIVMLVFDVNNCFIILICCIFNLRSCNFNCKVQIRQLFLNQWLKYWHIKKLTERTNLPQAKYLLLVSASF